MSVSKSKVTLPEGVSLKRVGQVLLDAWAVGSHRWTNSPLQLREGKDPSSPAPMPRDALELFRVLHERKISYLLVGGMAMLTYIEGRNTNDVGLLMSVEAMRAVPELRISNDKGWFVRGMFRSVQVDLLLTKNPLFQIVADRFATKHLFAELEVPAATVEGLIVLKLYALPSLYRQFNMDRVALYETDITLLLARHTPDLARLLRLVEIHTEPQDAQELRKIARECTERANRLRRRAAP
jgi:hypothetical protein